MPGLNGPGLVPAKKVPRVPKPDFESGVRDNGSLNHFWNPKGIMNSVPKMKGAAPAHLRRHRPCRHPCRADAWPPPTVRAGIITPKSTCGPQGASTCGRFDDYAANPDFKD